MLPAFENENNYQMILLETKSRSNFYSYLLYGTFSVMMLPLPVILIMKLITKLNDFNIILVFTSIQFMLGLLSLRMLLWFILGTEKVKIENDQLIIIKQGTFWIKNEIYFPLDKIKKINISKNFYEQNSPSELVQLFSRRMYIFKFQNKGRIKIINSDFSSYSFLDNIEFTEAEIIIKKIKTSCKNLVQLEDSN